MGVRWIMLGFFALTANNSLAQQPQPFADRVTGDWSGKRTRLAAQGVLLDLDYTQFWQGLLRGTGSKRFAFGHRVDLMGTFDTERLGWWKGGIFRVHAEHFGGPLNSNLGGALLPTSLGVRLPNRGHGRVTASNISLIQKLSPTAVLIVGKINTVDLLAGDPFFGGTGDRRFMNVAFAAPPNGLLSPVIMGAMVTLKSNPYDWTFMIFDPEDRTTEFFPSKLFGNGTNVSVSAKRQFQMDGRDSSISLTGMYSSASRLNLSEVLLPPGLQTGMKSGSYHASIQVSHMLRQTSHSKLGIHAKAGLSDGNPNPFQSFVSGGITGTGMIPKRPSDVFGVGYFYYNFSSDLKKAVTPFVPVRDESGLEAFYEAAISPGASL